MASSLALVFFFFLPVSLSRGTPIRPTPLPHATTLRMHTLQAPILHMKHGTCRISYKLQTEILRITVYEERECLGLIAFNGRWKSTYARFTRMKFSRR
jgi:hypothetical protein